MRNRFHITSLVSLTWLFLLFGNTLFGQEDILSKSIILEKQSTSLYNLLNTISEKSGCLFVYSSDVLDNDRKVKIPATRAKVSELLDVVLKGQNVAYKVLGKHILIYKESPRPVSRPAAATELPPDTSSFIQVRGIVKDKVNNDPIPYASVGISGEHRGTITNQDGYFMLKVPVSSMGSELLISHLGFISQSIPLDLLNSQKIEIRMERRIISIQEVIIRYIDPVSILTKAVENRRLNNQSDAVYMTTFYREGVMKNNRMLNYSEAVFKIYKSGYELSEKADQVKMLKSRKLSVTNQDDTISLKLKAGILTALQLDIIKCLPDFLDPETFSVYDFTYSDLVSYNHRNAYSISFSQEQGLDQFNYSGLIYVDAESYAILGADFEVDPRYIDKASLNLVKRKSKKLNVKFERINYSVSYLQYGGKYYLNHVRSELKIKTRHRNRLATDHFSTFLELVNCQIDTLNVTRFERQEQIKPDVIFADIPIIYDNSFWGEFNFIAPEEHLEMAINRMRGMIEKIE